MRKTDRERFNVLVPKRWKFENDSNLSEKLVRQLLFFLISVDVLWHVRKFLSASFKLANVARVLRTLDVIQYDRALPSKYLLTQNSRSRCPVLATRSSLFKP